MSSQPLQQGYLQQAVEAAASQPSYALQNAVLNQMAQEQQLNDLQRQAIFKAANVRDVTTVTPIESFLNSLANETTGGLTQLPENPQSPVEGIAGHLAAGFGVPWALAAGTAAIPVVGPAIAPFVPGAYAGGKGFARAYSEAQEAGQPFNVGAGLTRGLTEAGLAYLPVDKTKAGKQILGELLRNAGIAGGVETVSSALSQKLQSGRVTGERLVGDIVGQVAGQLGGDTIERFGPALKIASRSEAAADVAKALGLRKRADLAPSVKVPQLNDGVLQGGVAYNEKLAAENDQATVFQNRINQLQQLAITNPSGAKKQAELLMRQANLQASRAAEGSPEQVMFRQQARTVKQFLNAQAASKKGDAQLTELEAHRGTVADYEADGNSKQLMTLARLGRNKKVSGATPEARLEAAQLEKDAIEAMQRMGVTPEQVKAQKAAAKKTVSPEEKAIQNVEAIEGRYKLAVGEGGSKIDDGTADVKTLNKLRTAAANVETDPKAPEWLRSYSSQLKAQIDEDLSAIKTQKAEAQELVNLQKAIKEAQARTARAEQQQADKDRGVGLSRLKKDITTRAAEDAKVAKQQAQSEQQRIKAEQNAEAQKARVQAREEATAKRQQTVAESKKGVTTEKARIAKKFKPYEQLLDQKHKGMSETPRQIQKKLDNAADTGDVYEVHYYAEKAGASQEKEFLQRFLTIEGTGVDNAGRRYYTTVDQVNGTKETRKLFDGPEDSRITLATKTEKPLRYILDPDGNVVDLTTGDVVARTPVERMTTSEQQKALAEATEVGTVAKRLQAAAELSQKISENGSKPQETYRVIRKLSQSSRRQMSKDIKGVDC